MSSKTFFDMNSSDTYRWTLLDLCGRLMGEPRRVEWPPWLTCPEHYKQRAIDWSADKEFVHYLRQEGYAMSEPINEQIRDAHFPRTSAIITGISDPDCYTLSVRDTNNLVRHLYTGGWISHEQHPEVHELLDKMIAFLEARGIRVDMNMERL